MHRAKTGSCITVAILGLAAAGGALCAQTEEKKEKIQLVRVTVTVRDFTVTPATVRPGSVQVLLHNHTMMADPSVTFRLEGSAQAADQVRLVSPEELKGKSRWQKVTLKPGKYTVTLDQVAGVQSIVTVEP